MYIVCCRYGEGKLRSAWALVDNKRGRAGDVVLPATATLKVRRKHEDGRSQVPAWEHKHCGPLS
jgi:hypothetical protein